MRLSPVAVVEVVVVCLVSEEVLVRGPESSGKPLRSPPVSRYQSESEKVSLPTFSKFLRSSLILFFRPSSQRLCVPADAPGHAYETNR